MGGAFGTLVCVVAVFIFYGTGHPVLLSFAVGVLFVEFLSLRHMCYFAKTLARNRLFVEKLNSGDLGSSDASSNEAKQYWDHLTKTIGMKDTNLQDVIDVPDWITKVNIVAFTCGIVLTIYCRLSLANRPSIIT